MTIAVGSIIPASDYVAIRNVIAPVMGVPATGSTYGYNQTLVSAAVATGNRISASNWNGLYTDLARAYAHITGTAPSAGTLPVISAGTKIKASDIAAYANVANYCSANRLAVAASALSVVGASGGSIITRGAAWGGGASGIGAQMNIQWGSEAAAAAFFNTGGRITINFGHPNASTAQDASWYNFLNSLGTVTFSSTGSSISGGTTALANIPYSAMPGAVTNVLVETNTTASYTANYIQIQVAKIGNGFAVIIYMEDNHTNAYYDQVAAGTYAAFGYVRSIDTNQLPNPMTVPSFGISTNF
jgi:hypothetical protein